MQYLIYVGLAVTLVMNVPYAIATVRGQVKPNKISWLLWTLAPAIGLFASISKGWNMGEFPVVVSVGSTFLILICSFINRKSYWAIERFDWVCGGLSLVALASWALTHQPDLAIALSILADILASFPTLRKAWKAPETEGVGPFAAGVFNAATSFFAMTVWNFTTLAFPIYLLLINLLLALIIARQYFGKHKQQKKAENA